LWDELAGECRGKNRPAEASGVATALLDLFDQPIPGLGIAL
jgi:hypothetical protein